MVSAPPPQVAVKKIAAAALPGRHTATRAVLLFALICVLLAATTDLHVTLFSHFSSGDGNPPLSFAFEHSDLCGDYSFNRTFTRLGGADVSFDQHPYIPSILTANWTGLLPVSFLLPFSTSCLSARPVSADQARQPVSVDSLLCTRAPPSAAQKQQSKQERQEEEEERSKRSTLALHFPDDDEYYNNFINHQAATGLDLWHFHAEVYPMWLSLRLVELTLARMRDTPDIMSSAAFKSGVFDGLRKPIDLILLFPDHVWTRFSSAVEPFVLDGTGVGHALALGADETALAGLQGLRDTLWSGGKLVVATHSTPLSSLQATMRNHAMNERPIAWYSTPPAHLLWRMAYRDILPWTGDCRDSTVYQYAKDLMASAHIAPQQSVARQVCLISRQTLVKREFVNTRKDIKSRNLAPKLFDTLTKRLTDPIILEVNIALRNNDSHVEHPSDSSISGQMRFINENCGVLVSAHGPALSHILALKPGAHVVEFQGAFKYLMYRNLAALSNDITHTLVKCDSVVVDKVLNHEVNLTLTPTKVDRVVDMINDKLVKSVNTQTKALSALEE